MNRKAWKRIALVLLLLLGSLLSACTTNPSETSDQEVLTESAYLAEARESTADEVGGEIPLFFTNNTATSLYEVKRTYDFSGRETADIVETILYDLNHVEILTEEDMAELEDLTISSIIPSGVYSSHQIRSEESGEVLEMHLTNLYYDMTPNERLVLRAGLSRTFFTSGVIDELEFWAPIQGEESGGETMVSSSSENDKLIINQYSRDFYTDEAQVTLYFANADGTALVPETRTLTLGMTDLLPLAVVRALIDGPQTEGLTSVIPEGTMIEEVFMKDGVCYVDLSAEFQKNHIGGELKENLTIYSIVNSLQSVDGVRYVQFLIEGKRVEYYKSYTRLDTFLTSNMDIVEQTE